MRGPAVAAGRTRIRCAIKPAAAVAVHLNDIPRETASPVLQANPWKNSHHATPAFPARRSSTGMPYFTGFQRAATRTAFDAHPGHGSLTLDACHFNPQSRHLMVVLYLRRLFPGATIADKTCLTFFILQSSPFLTMPGVRIILSLWCQALRLRPGYQMFQHLPGRFYYPQQFIIISAVTFSSPARAAIFMALTTRLFTDKGKLRFTVRRPDSRSKRLLIAS